MAYHSLPGISAMNQFISATGSRRPHNPVLAAAAAAGLVCAWSRGENAAGRGWCRRRSASLG
eukprot:566887-Prymnesium_polylepis.1